MSKVSRIILLFAGVLVGISYLLSRFADTKKDVQGEKTPLEKAREAKGEIAYLRRKCSELGIDYSDADKADDLHRLIKIRERDEYKKGTGKEIQDEKGLLDTDT